ncbi:MAG: DUF1697 domain-containing protein [Trueperaceae bacterium]|nr:DUF1697 domain-containing protein [Trueperaceae bacterium]
MSVVRAAFLLRGINVGGHRRVPMADLRAVAGSTGLTDPRTYVASGNLVAGSPADVGAAAARLADALAERIGFDVDVVARDARAWARYAADAPFPDVDAANRVLLYLPRDPAPAGVLDALSARLGPGERAVPTVDGVWVFHADGAGRSKLTPAAIDAAFGSPTTGRNARTVAAIAGLLGVG